MEPCFELPIDQDGGPDLHLQAAKRQIVRDLHPVRQQPAVSDRAASPGPPPLHVTQHQRVVPGRDVGALNLSLLVLTVAALVVGVRVLSRATAAAWIVYSVPHLVYHLRHLSMPMPGVEKVVLVASLSTPIVAAIIVLFDRARVVAPAIDLVGSPGDTDGSRNLTQVSVRK